MLVCPRSPPPESCSALTVLYDGACPLCRREVGVYRGLEPLQPLAWLDVSDAATPLPIGADRDACMARFHVRHGDGRLLSGAAAFVALWATLPGWRWLARVAGLPGVTPLLEVAYRAFLKLRPALQRLARAAEPSVPQAQPATSGSTAPMALAVPTDLIADLRSDHAGETGAVWIYHGVLAVSRDAGVREFARRHRETEQRHLDHMEDLLPARQRSRLLVPWRAAGFMTGALPALFGARAVYGTIAAVETFVDPALSAADRSPGRSSGAPRAARVVAHLSGRRVRAPRRSHGTARTPGRSAAASLVRGGRGRLGRRGAPRPPDLKRGR